MKYNEFYQHPLEEHNRLIEKRGVMVFHDITRMPVYGEAYVSHHAVVGVNHKGYIKGEYDLHPFEFHPHEVAVIYPDHIIRTEMSSEDYHASIIVISRPILKKLQHRSSYQHQLEYMSQPAFLLSDEQYRAVCQAIGTLQAISQMELPAHEDMLLNMLDILSQMLDVYRFSGKPSSMERPRSQKMFYQFYDDLVQHYRESHEVQFYATRLCLTPKYFASIIKRETGISATDWIANYVVMQAQSLLQQEYTIQQISDMLGFTEQSAFSRHFKHHTGLSPSEYRNKR